MKKRVMVKKQQKFLNMENWEQVQTTLPTQFFITVFHNYIPIHVPHPITPTPPTVQFSKMGNLVAALPRIRHCVVSAWFC
jgi:hypothetical protein